MLKRQPGARIPRVGVLACALLCAAASWLCGGLAAAADGWGGSVGATTDYLVRGASRTANDPALQLDVHYSNSWGLVAGAFASNARINPREAIDAELSAFLGYAYSPNDSWRGRLLYSHYAYPWNHAGSGYDYDELEAQIAYQGWLQVNFSYSPDYPRFVMTPYRELRSVPEESLEVNVQRGLFGRLSATGGVGLAYLSGPEGRGYVYMSLGAAYDAGPISLALAYVNTSSAAKYLFYNNAASNRVIGTVIWRF